ncbi:hypothetical protein [Streptomyces mirabilis]|uniref:Uncharacterized protein n=1 Tax=Streptomyces mirabilis TaxID=68239 RepID=A0ABU3V5Z6_9ACTN|nr:hypothetical protein [Streptomyces mirabilis]MCX5357055.1 hypothetical protein [Streptomyces mirabilis]MDU9001592.1 hypothetical protein [Streptomyces mirabilis]
MGFSTAVYRAGHSYSLFTIFNFTEAETSSDAINWSNSIVDEERPRPLRAWPTMGSALRIGRRPNDIAVSGRLEGGPVDLPADPR